MIKLNLITWVAAILLLLIPAQAISSDEPSSDYCFLEVAERYGVHPSLVWAIAKVESGFHPYAIGYREKKGGVNKSMFPNSVEEAKGKIDWLLDMGYDFDLGVGQINLYNIRAYGIDPYDLLDTCYNLHWSAYILRTMIDTYGYTWEGISKYNGGGLKYAKKVWTALEELEYVQARGE